MLHSLWPASPRLRWLLVLVVALHTALGAGVGLSVDEAHYALYAAHPAWSYFDHPPLVGWVQWPWVALGVPEAILRLVPGGLWLLCVLGVYSLTLRMDNASPAVERQQAATTAVSVLLLAPLLHILGIGLLPDTLLMVLTVALMHQTLSLMRSPVRGTLVQWLVMGGLLGLAGLSKYTAVLEALAVIACVVHAHGWKLLRRGAVWAAVAVALVFILPVLGWNAQNHWVSFTYQIRHGAGSVWQAAHVAQFLVVQLLVFGPLLGWGLWELRPARLRALGKEASLVWFFVVPMVLLTYMSGGGSSLPHWTAPAWVALAPWAGAALVRTWAQARRAVRGAMVALACLQAVLCLALPGLMLSGGWPLVSAPAQTEVDAVNPFADVHGWDQAGQRVRALAQERGLSSVSVQNWTLASRIGWYARPLPVHVLEDRFDQFDLWAGDLPVGADTLLLDWSQMAYVTPVGAHGFERCAMLERLPVMQGGRRLATFTLYDCRHWHGDPQPRLRSSEEAR